MLHLGKPVKDNRASYHPTMAFCPECGKSVLPTDKFCLNCGYDMSRGFGGVSQTATSAPFQRPLVQTPTPSGEKNGTLAALLNFFLPGLGYVYVGIGKEIGDAIFGILVFIFYFIGFEVTTAFDILTTPVAPATTTEASISPVALLIFLVALLPIAFAYDGYRRAKLV